MDKQIFNQIKKENNMTCTQLQFETFMTGVTPKTITNAYKFHTFKDKFNGHIIHNPTSDNNAVYYTIVIDGVTYLQTHDYSKSGFVPITKTNQLSLVTSHIAQLKFNIQENHKFNSAILNFKK